MKLNLKKEFFSDKEFLLAEHQGMTATAFRYSTGVEAIRVENSKGYFIILPFQGQQIWRAVFLGQDLVMKGMFEEPDPIGETEYLETYGAFLLHCGVKSFGVPQADDDHPLHGETPNAAYKNAYLLCGEDENGAYMSVGGVLNYNKAFTQSYTFSPECKLYQNDTVLKINVTLKNNRKDPMEYMYLAHINFRPVDGAELVYSADYDKEHIKVHKRIADNVPKQKHDELLDFMNKVQENPSLHHKIGVPEERYDPEICFAISYKGDEQNRAYTMQYTNDGAGYVSHPVDILPVGVRWIARTAHEDAMGMVLPATSEHLGYQNAKRAGQVKVLGGEESVSFLLEAGYLEKMRADQMKKKIESM